MKILIVDDEQDVLDLLRELFIRKGYQVQYTTNGRVALDILSKDRPDVMLLDVKMPEMDGIKVLEAVKKKDASIDVVMLTAYGYNDKLINEAIEKGASGYISKNLPLEQIINTFNTLLKSMQLKKKI
ncbi:MAG: response regulator [Candidatus Omnitrophica bacterium]|nr:response regulator [Candidatus Omnitrophota bacterium]